MRARLAKSWPQFVADDRRPPTQHRHRQRPRPDAALEHAHAGSDVGEQADRREVLGIDDLGATRHPDDDVLERRSQHPVLGSPRRPDGDPLALADDVGVGHVAVVAVELTALGEHDEVATALRVEQHHPLPRGERTRRVSHARAATWPGGAPRSTPARAPRPSPPCRQASRRVVGHGLVEHGDDGAGAIDLDCPPRVAQRDLHLNCVPRPRRPWLAARSLALARNGENCSPLVALPLGRRQRGRIDRLEAHPLPRLQLLDADEVRPETEQLAQQTNAVNGRVQRSPARAVARTGDWPSCGRTIIV